MRSNNSTPVGGASGTNQSRKSPLGDKEDNQRTSSRGSGGGSRSQQNDQSRGQRGGNGRSTSRGRPRGNNAGGQNAGGNSRSQGGQGSFNRFASNFNRSKGPLKFDEDYDFESANVKVNFGWRFL